ncbi:MAG: hypothetical protein N3A38_09320 [Planctomycetota bacterium]|nr:hypothetical protein [Planctomycetota bacterium]
MSAVGAILKARLQELRNAIVLSGRESALKIVVVSVLGLSFWVGLFAMFNESFRFVRNYTGDFNRVLLEHVMHLFFLTLAIMLVFSNAIISFATLFKAPETEFLASKPIRPDTLYACRAAESLAFSSWAFLALALPMLLAYGIQNDVRWMFYLWIAAFLPPFVLLPAAGGALLSLLITSVVPRHRGKALGVLILAAAAVAAALMVEMVRIRAGRGILTDEAVAAILSRLGFARNPLLPNYWITRGLLGAADGNTGEAVFFFLVLLSNAAFAAVLGFFLAGYLYPRAYSEAQGAGGARRRGAISPLDLLFPAADGRRGILASLVLKDAKSFLRDPVQWSQALIFFGLLAVYVANLRNFAYDLDHPFFRNLVGFLNLGATCMTMATLTSRFVFPLISLEGPRFWVVGTAPIERRNLLLSKFIFSLAGSLLVVEGLVLLSNFILKSDRMVFAMQAYMGAAVCVGLTGLSAGMGALFPNFRERSPSKIVSGFGGTLTLILSVFMVLAAIVPQAIVCHMALVPPEPDALSGSRLAWSVAATLGFATLLTASCACIPMRLGLRALERMEF